MDAAIAGTSMVGQMRVHMDSHIKTMEEKCKDLPKHHLTRLHAWFADSAEAAAEPDGNKLMNSVARYLDVFAGADDFQDKMIDCFASMQEHEYSNWG
ncbi:hypothetical protein CDD83_2717 [Cordyceps sp. RAO-2017]|nr:hypothetical protein CDD83_2717 [Cordyceps sp. RAO-2017]